MQCMQLPLHVFKLYQRLNKNTQFYSESCYEFTTSSLAYFNEAIIIIVVQSQSFQCLTMIHSLFSSTCLGSLPIFWGRVVELIVIYLIRLLGGDFANVVQLCLNFSHPHPFSVWWLGEATTEKIVKLLKSWHEDGMKIPQTLGRPLKQLSGIYLGDWKLMSSSWMCVKYIRHICIIEGSLEV